MLRTIAIDVFVAWASASLSVRLSRGFAVQTRLNGSRSGLDGDLETLGVKERNAGSRLPIFRTDSMQPLPNYFGHLSH